MLEHEAPTVYADLLRMNGLREEGIRFLEQAAAANPVEALRYE